MIIFHKGFNFGQDGPGNRLVYHLQGCNFRCAWCSNPESMAKRPSTDEAEEKTPEEVVKEVLSCRKMFFSGGGVTFTGGEPTLWHNELLSVLSALHDERVHTCIETNGSDPRLTELLPFIDFLIMDIKQPDAEIHRANVGTDNKITLRNIGNVLDSGRQVLLRIPLIHGVNTDPAPFLEFFGSHPMDAAQIEILPYHEYGKDKWKEPYTVTNGFVTDDELSAMKTAFSERGYRLIRT